MGHTHLFHLTIKWSQRSSVVELRLVSETHRKTHSCCLNESALVPTWFGWCIETFSTTLCRKTMFNARIVTPFESWVNGVLLFAPSLSRDLSFIWRRRSESGFQLNMTVFSFGVSEGTEPSKNKLVPPSPALARLRPNENWEALYAASPFSWSSSETPSPLPLSLSPSRSSSAPMAS